MASPQSFRPPWIEQLQGAFSKGADALQATRSWGILLSLDGTIIVGNVDTAHATIGVYPARCRIHLRNHLNILEKFPAAEHRTRIEHFALESMVYEITTLSKPYPELTDDEVQRHYEKGNFPWKTEGFVAVVRSLVCAPPYAFGLQAAGLTVAAIPFVAPLALGNLRWVLYKLEVHLPGVSAVMGGVAASNLATAGTTGAALAGAATVATTSWKEKAMDVFNRGNTKEEEPKFVL